MSEDGSWWGGETSYEYIDPKQEALKQLVKDREMQHAMFDLMHKGMSNKPSDIQTSNPSCKMESGRFS